MRTISGFTTFAHLCWHCTSLRSGNWPAMMSHRNPVPCCSAVHKTRVTRATNRWHAQRLVKVNL
ncbi:hypothetical protein PUN28_007330 [Cardiocondyla obscurior]|uniref:Secreted protein n=1 Tax=Cardiocondyla obscurior TaxID=286306 RepID=A0AAW2G3C7_9HYME